MVGKRLDSRLSTKRAFLPGIESIRGQRGIELKHMVTEKSRQVISKAYQEAGKLASQRPGVRSRSFESPEAERQPTVSPTVINFKFEKYKYEIIKTLSPFP